MAYKRPIVRCASIFVCILLNGKNVSCEFCAFKDICYVDEKNKVYLVSEEEEVE